MTPNSRKLLDIFELVKLGYDRRDIDCRHEDADADEGISMGHL